MINRRLFPSRFNSLTYLYSLTYLCFGFANCATLLPTSIARPKYRWEK